ncbi:MAG TPA: sigma-54-dependent Fis family transcriptional regulator [Gammaproteobacteria bacterium]|nr:sigma-54-dependent Fis family transcriptional regulator [Gammaproteobacteria bacterium]
MKSEGTAGRERGDHGGVGRRILIVEDEGIFARAVAKRLSRVGYDCVVAGDLRSARGAVNDRVPDLILLDMRLPDGSGLDFLVWLREQHGNEAAVLVLSAFGELEDAVAAMKLNASDYLKKPIDLDELQVNVEKVLVREEVAKELTRARSRERAQHPEVIWLGEDPKMTAIRQQAARIGGLAGQADVIPPTVLILGETGTGKDVAARMLHALSARKDRPFVHVDCASLPKDLIEAELFGHEKGAFTHAMGERIGLIEAAGDGTVFLDEVGELPLELQAKLLAILERRSLRRVGSSHERRTEAWFIAATNRDLKRLAAEGSFRSDLYFRLNVLTLAMPALRDRGGDVHLLADHFALSTATRYGLPAVMFTERARAALEAYRWPGNVRELKHVIERAVLLVGGGRVDAADLLLSSEGSASTGEAQAAQEGAGLSVVGLTLDEAERRLIESALHRTHWNVSEAARQLGITRMVMRHRMKKYNLGG